MKKIMSLMLGAVMLVSLAACGSAGTDGRASSGVTLYDDKGVKIVSKDYEADEESGYNTLTLVVESKRENDIVVVSDDVYINNVLAGDCSFQIPVSANDKVEQKVQLPMPFMKAVGVHEANQIGLSMTVMDMKNYVPLGYTDYKTLSLDGKKPAELVFNATSAANMPETANIIVEAAYESDTEQFGPALFVHVDNNRAEPVDVNLTNICVNGVALKSNLVRYETLRSESDFVTVIPVYSDFLPEGVTADSLKEFSFHYKLVMAEDQFEGTLTVPVK